MTHAILRQDRYFLATRTDAVAKFLSKVTSHRAKLAAFNLLPAADQRTAKFPMPPSKGAKGHAYDDAAVIQTLLAKSGIESERAHDVQGLARIMGQGMALLNDSVDAEALAAEMASNPALALA